MLRLHHIAMASVVVLGAGFAVPARADHVCREYHHEQFHASIRQLNEELRQRDRALHCEVEEARKCIHADIRRAHKTLCGHERDLVVRRLHDQLNDVNRRFHRQLRALHEEIADRRRCLHRDLEVALQSCRTSSCGSACSVGRPVVAPFAQRPPGHHAWGDQASGHRPRGHRDGGFVPGYPDRYTDVDPSRNYRAAARPEWDRRDDPRGRQQDVDWQSLVLELLARRMGR